MTFFPGPINLLILMLCGELGDEDASVDAVTTALLGPHPSGDRSALDGAGDRSALDGVLPARRPADASGGGRDLSSRPVSPREIADRAEVVAALRLLWKHYAELGPELRTYVLQARNDPPLASRVASLLPVRPLACPWPSHQLASRSLTPTRVHLQSAITATITMLPKLGPPPDGEPRSLEPTSWDERSKLEAVWDDQSKLLKRISDPRLDDDGQPLPQQQAAAAAEAQTLLRRMSDARARQQGAPPAVPPPGGPSAAAPLVSTRTAVRATPHELFVHAVEHDLLGPLRRDARITKSVLEQVPPSRARGGGGGGRAAPVRAALGGCALP